MSGERRPGRAGGREDPFTALLAEASTVDLRDRLDVESYLSAILGAGSRATARLDAAGELAVLLGIVDHLQTSSGPTAAALLAAMRTLAPAEEARQAAHLAYAKLLARGAPPPLWSDTEVRLRECWRAGDVFGDQINVVCIFDGGAATRHALVALVDDGRLPDGPVVVDAFLSDDPDAVLADLRATAASEQLMGPVGHADPSAIRALLEAGLANSTRTDVSVDEDLVAKRALALARCRAMPKAADRLPDYSLPSSWDISMLMSDFLADHTDLFRRRDPDVVTALGLIAEFHLLGRLRVSPHRTTDFLRDFLPGRLPRGGTGSAVLPDVLLAFNRWAGARHQGLPEAAIEVLEDVTRESTRQCGW